MSKAGPDAMPRMWPWWLLCCIGLPVLVLLHVGQDSNWDLQNYHLYNPHAWLHGRLTTDIAPAQLQSWHNPLLDVPFYLLVQARLPGLIAGLWLTVPFMLGLYFLLRLQELLGPQPKSRIACVVLSVVALSGAATYSEIGTCLNDGFVAAGMLGALLLALRNPGLNRGWFFGGLVGGAVIGLKLTAAMYCFGLAASALAVAPLRASPQRLLWLALGGMLGVMLTFGYWGWTVQHLHANPTFPYFNQVFQSPDAQFAANTDNRFRPTSIVDALQVPFRLLFNNHLYSELDIRDPRLLIGVIGFLILPWWRPANTTSPDGTGRKRALAAFFFVSLVLWLYQYGIYRYAMPLEMLAALPLALLAQSLPARWSPAALLLGGLLTVAATHRPDWSHQKFGPVFLRISMPALPKDSLVVLSGKQPVAYAVTALRDDVPAISVYNNFMKPYLCTRMQTQAERRITEHVGPIWLLRTAKQAGDAGQELLEDDYGLRANGLCNGVPSNLGDLELCPLRREPHAALCTAQGNTLRSGSGLAVSGPKQMASSAVLDIQPATLRDCDPRGAPIVAKVHWDASALEVTDISIYVETPGANGRLKLWLRGGASGTSETGRWVRARSRFTLVDTAAGSVLAQAKVTAQPCE